MGRTILGLAILAALAGDATADSVTIAFDPLAADAGQVVTTAFDESGYTVTVNDALVIGPGSPGYSGAIGLLPLPDEFSVVIQPIRGPLILESVSATFAPGSSATVDWYGESGLGPGNPVWDWPGTGQTPGAYTAPGSYDTTLEPASATAGVWLESNLDNGGQITSVTIVAVPAPVPEPPAAALLAGGLLTFLIGPRRRRKQKAPARESGDRGIPADTAGQGGPSSLPSTDESIEFRPTAGPVYPPGAPSLRWRRGEP
jgi:hypothetical protein